MFKSIYGKSLHKSRFCSFYLKSLTANKDLSFIYLFSPEKWPFCEQPESHLAERINVDQFVLYMQVRTISTWVNLCQREGASLKPTTYQTNIYESICNNYLYGLVEMKVDYKVRDHGFNM